MSKDTPLTGPDRGRAASAFDPHSPPLFGGRRLWLCSTVLVPVTTVLVVWALLGADRAPGVVIGLPAVLFAVLYAGATFGGRLDPWGALLGYLVAAAMTVVWGYALWMGAIVYLCHFAEQCPFS